METPVGIARRSVAMILVVPSQRDTLPVTSTTLLPNSLPLRTNRSCQTIICTSLVSSSMVTNTVPSFPLGCCLATGQPATLTLAPSFSPSPTDVGSTSASSLGLTNCIRCPLG